MAEDIKSLTKKNASLEQRLKIAEAKIKALADNMTNPKDIEKFMSVVIREQSDLDKKFQREKELVKKIGVQERKLIEKENAQMTKEYEKQGKQYAKEAELQMIKTRLKIVEALVQAALAK